MEEQPRGAFGPWTNRWNSQSPVLLTIMAASSLREQGHDVAADLLVDVCQAAEAEADFNSGIEGVFRKIAKLLGNEKSLALIVKEFDRKTVVETIARKPGAPTSISNHLPVVSLIDLIRVELDVDVIGACRLIVTYGGLHLKSTPKFMHLTTVHSIRSVYYRCRAYYLAADPAAIERLVGYTRELSYLPSEKSFEAWLSNLLRGWKRKNGRQ